MLTNREIVTLKNDSKYRKLSRVGLKTLVADLIRAGDNSGLKPDVESLFRIALKLGRARIIRGELYRATSDLLERSLNTELEGWPRNPDGIRIICEFQQASYLWMRYDNPRVKALFSHTKYVLTEAEIIEIIKEHSSLSEQDKIQKLKEILHELIKLENLTIQTIATRKIFDVITNLRADTYYKENEDKIRQEFIEAGKNGRLGLAPPQAREEL